MTWSALIAVVSGTTVLLAAAASRPAARRSQHTQSSSNGARNHHSTADAELDQALALLEQLARDVRAGASFAAALPPALSAYPTVSPSLRLALQRGAPVGEELSAIAVEATSRRNSDGTELLVVHALRAAHAAGGNGQAALERAAAVARERRAWRQERRAHSAQARLSARLLTLLPPLFAMWVVISDERVRSAYRTSPLPALCTATGLALNLAGWWWMRRLVGGDR